MPVAYHEPSTPTPPSSSSSSSSEWGPYSDSKDFTSNMVIILIILFCFLVLLFALNALIRYLLFPLHRHHRRSHHPFSIDDPEKNPCQKPAASAADVGPTLVFSASIREKIAGTGAECSICLAEFADGDRVLVLQACSHSFHVSCIERWLVTKESCPTCRASCHVAPV